VEKNGVSDAGTTALVELEVSPQKCDDNLEKNVPKSKLYSHHQNLFISL